MVEARRERWIFARPRGGLNDILCQVEKCWRFAEKTGRQIAFDTRDSGLLLDFEDVFEVLPNNRATKPQAVTAELVEHLNGMTAFPSDTQGNVTSYDKYKDELDEFHTFASHQDLKFDLSRDYPAEVVVYEGMGGGVASFCALKRLTLQPWLNEQIVSALQELPLHYIAVHVRHSDLKSDYEAFLRKVVGQAGSWPVFFASDNDEVIEFARGLFGADRTLTRTTSITRAGQPLHDPALARDESERRQRTADMFVELFCLAGGKELYYTDVNERFGVSGFSRLAGFLAQHPDLRARLLGTPPLQVLTKGTTRHLASPRRQLIESLRWWRDVRCRFHR